MNIITRKIQLLINDEDYKAVYKKLYDWQEITFRASNYIATHLYIQENLSEFLYFTEDFKLNLSNKIDKNDQEGVLNTSRQNSTYRLISSKFLGQIPSSILTSLNQNVSKTFKAERKEYFSGKKSLRNYKRNSPIPFSSTDLRNFTLNENDYDYDFELFGLKFRTKFGIDRSNNKLILERGLSGEYKINGSSIKIKDKKIFLLLTVSFKSEEIILKPNRSAVASLSVYQPIKVQIGKKSYDIGNKEEFLFRRNSIKNSMYRIQKSLKYTTGGRGRKQKLQKLNDFANYESDYIKTRLHTYSKELIDLCLHNKCSKIIIANQAEEFKSIEAKLKEIEASKLSRYEKEKEAEKYKFLLSSWSWNGLLTFIKYKADIYGIELIQED